MIRLLRGQLVSQRGSATVIDVQGVGYEVFVPTRTVLHVGRVDLWIHHHFWQDGQALYGFEVGEELQIFEHLLTVPSVGPKLALAILSAAAPGEIRQAVETDNVGFFQALPGVGKKSAAKIIVELKGKLSGGEVVLPTGGSQLHAALQSLGYSDNEVLPVLKRIPGELTDTEAQVSWALRELGK